MILNLAPFCFSFDVKYSCMPVHYKTNFHADKETVINYQFLQFSDQNLNLVYKELKINQVVIPPQPPVEPTMHFVENSNHVMKSPPN